eukprot:g62516.t1
MKAPKQILKLSGTGATFHPANASTEGGVSSSSAMSKESKNEGPWELYYWPGLPGRGEYIRLVLEAGSMDYVDVARLPAEKGGGPGAIAAFLSHVGKKETNPPIFAPPFIKRGDLVLSQTQNICLFLAQQCGLAPKQPEAMFRAHSIAMTIQDFVSEIHDTHHPIDVTKYYEEQKTEAIARSAAFCRHRMSKFLNYLERVVKANQKVHAGSKFMMGDALSYLDLATFQTLEGLSYAFPKSFAQASANTPLLQALRQAVAAHGKVAAYLKSPRRMAFNQTGIFRRYPELDLPSTA